MRGVCGVLPVKFSDVSERLLSLLSGDSSGRESQGAGK